MGPPHRIRLDAGWEIADPPPISPDSDAHSPSIRRRFHLNEVFQSESISATRIRRVFHRPTNLLETESLWLVLAELPEATVVHCNGVRLKPAGDANIGVRRFELPVSSLTLSNSILLEIPAGDSVDVIRQPGSAWLEIH